MTSLTFDLTSDQEKLPRKSEEPFKRATEEDPSLRMDRSNRCHVYR